MEQTAKVNENPHTRRELEEDHPDVGGPSSFSAETPIETENSVWERIARIRADIAERTCGRSLADADLLIDGGRD